MTDELKNIKPDRSFIPEGCLSFVEESVYIVSAIDEDFEDMMESLNLLEGEECAPEAEPDTEPVEDTNESAVITEKVDMKAAKNAIVEFLKKIWARIKGAFKAIVKWIDDRKADANQKGLKKALDKWDKVEFKADAKLGSFHNAEGIASPEPYTALKALIMGSANRAVGDDVNNMPYNILNRLNIADGAKQGEVDVKTMRSKLKEYFLGKEVVEVTGADFGKHKDKIAKILDGSQKQAVKTAYNQAREDIDLAIKQAKSAKDDYAADVKDKKVELDKDKKSALAYEFKSIKRYGQLLSTVVAVNFDAIRTQNHEAFVIASKVALKAQKKEGKAEKKEEVKTESVDIFAW